MSWIVHFDRGGVRGGIVYTVWGLVETNGGSGGKQRVTRKRRSLFMLSSQILDIKTKNNNYVGGIEIFNYKDLHVAICTMRNLIMMRIVYDGIN